MNTVDDYHKNVDKEYNRDADRCTSFEKIDLIFRLINNLKCNRRERYLLVMNFVYRYMIIHIKEDEYRAWLEEISEFIINYDKEVEA